MNRKQPNQHTRHIRWLKICLWALLVLSVSATAIVVGLDAPADFPVDI